MRKAIGICLSALLLGGVFSVPAGAAVEGEIERTLQLTAKPLDVAVALNGNWIFVLTEKGSVQVFNPAGRLEGEIAVGKNVNALRVGPREDLLVLTSTEGKTVQIVSLDFIRPVNVSGAPFKGPAEAPVVIAVFSDFE